MTRSTRDDVNVRSSHYFIARTDVLCPRCGWRNGLAALLVPPGHELRQCDAEEGDARARGNWDEVPCYAFLFHVEYLASADGECLTDRFPSFQYRSLHGHASWANRCVHCDYAWPDEDLFCEPGGAFLPTSAAAGAKIQFISRQLPLRATAAGHAPDPMFVAVPLDH